MGCPGQLARTTTIPHGPLNILQAQEQVRHRGGDRRAHRGSNPGRGRNKSHDWPQQLDPQVQMILYFDFTNRYQDEGSSYGIWAHQYRSLWTRMMCSHMETPLEMEEIRWHRLAWWSWGRPYSWKLIHHSLILFHVTWVD